MVAGLSGAAVHWWEEWQLRVLVLSSLEVQYFLHHMGTDSCHEFARRCREISNYMMHLLVNNPEMLMAGSRQYLFTTAFNEIEDILKGEEILKLNDKELAETIIGKAQSAEGFVHDAWTLAQGLINLGDENKMWKMIQGVWVEMLCFSAGRCRGYLHAKSLASGGEYLSSIWLMLSHAGMETLPEKLQRTQKFQSSEEKRKHKQNKRQDVATSSNTHGIEIMRKRENDFQVEGTELNEIVFS